MTLAPASGYTGRMGHLRAVVTIIVLLAWAVAGAGSILAQNEDEAEATETGQEAGEAAPSAESQPKAVRPGRTGLPLPRFVSLRSGEVNLRTGPGKRYPIDWVYQRPGLPVEVIDEFDTWRRIRDWQGAVGWVHQSMLRGRRMVMVAGERRLLRRDPDGQSPGVAYLEPGVLGELKGCEALWCEITAGGYSGWLHSEAFYGLYPSELLK